MLFKEQKNQQKAVEFMETYGGSMSHQKQMTFIKELPEHLETPLACQLLVTISDSKLCNFWAEDGVYKYEDVFEDIKVYFAVENVLIFDDAYRVLHFRNTDDLSTMNTQLKKYIKLGIYKSEQKILDNCSDRILNEWKPLGPTARTALYTALQANERNAKFAKRCWKFINGTRISKPPMNRADKFAWNIVSDEVSYGFSILDKENDTTDSVEIDVKSSLDDYDNYNYDGTDIVVNLEGDKKDYGYYGGY